MVKNLIALASLASALGAHAALLGSTVQVDFYAPDDSTFVCSSGSAVVGNDVEFPSGCGGYLEVSISLSDHGMKITNPIGWGAGAFDGLRLSVLSGPAIVGAKYFDGTMPVTSLAVDTSGLWVNFAGQVGGEATVWITTVPEPQTYALMGLGLLGVATAALRPCRAASPHSDRLRRATHTRFRQR